MIVSSISSNNTLPVTTPSISEELWKKIAGYLVSGEMFKNIISFGLVSKGCFNICLKHAELMKDPLLWYFFHEVKMLRNQLTPHYLFAVDNQGRHYYLSGEALHMLSSPVLYIFDPKKEGFITLDMLKLPREEQEMTIGTSRDDLRFGCFFYLIEGGFVNKRPGTFSIWQFEQSQPTPKLIAFISSPSLEARYYGCCNGRYLFGSSEEVWILDRPGGQPSSGIVESREDVSKLSERGEEDSTTQVNSSNLSQLSFSKPPNYSLTHLFAKTNKQKSVMHRQYIRGQRVQNASKLSERGEEDSTTQINSSNLPQFCFSMPSDSFFINFAGTPCLITNRKVEGVATSRIQTISRVEIIANAIQFEEVGLVKGLDIAPYTATRSFGPWTLCSVASDVFSPTTEPSTPVFIICIFKEMKIWIGPNEKLKLIAPDIWSGEQLFCFEEKYLVLCYRKPPRIRIIDLDMKKEVDSSGVISLIQGKLFPQQEWVLFFMRRNEKKGIDFMIQNDGNERNPPRFFCTFSIPSEEFSL